MRNNKERICPICQKKYENADSAPFCSVRCQQVDLYKWLNNDYAVPTDEVAIIDDDEQ